MPEVLSRAALEDMLQTTKVDVGNGTLFGVSNLRKPESSRLTLVISTGGSGMSSIKEAMRIANQKLDKTYSNYVKFLIVDSATGEVDYLAKKGIRTLNLSAVGAKDRMKEDVRPEFFRSFVPRSYNVSLLNPDGASQDRMTGKIKLYDYNPEKGANNDHIFRTIIADLFKNDWAVYKNLPVDIMILTGISGGNGSGTFQDLAVIAKDACPYPGNVRVYGYIMLPDTADKFADTVKAQMSLHRNGYAALKELESKMSLVMEQHATQTVATNDGNITVSATNLPFDYPVLISGEYDKAVSMIAETIVNSVADSNGQFNQASFYSNLYTERGNRLAGNVVAPQGALIPGVCPEDSHMYCGIGFAQASIPEKIVIPNVVAKVVDKLYVPDDTLGLATPGSATAFCSQSKKLNRFDFEKQIRILFGFKDGTALAADSLWKNKISPMMVRNSKLNSNPVDIERDQIVTGNWTKFINGYKVSQTAETATQKIQEDLKVFYQEFLKNAAQVMKIYGPRAIEYLYTGAGEIDPKTNKEEDLTEISIRKMLDTVANQIQKLPQGQYPGKLEPVNIITGFFREKFKREVDDWKNSAQTAAQKDVYYKVGKNLTSVNGVWFSTFRNKIDNFYQMILRFADVLEVMTAFYKSQGKSLDSVDFHEFARTTGELNGINLCSDGDVYDWVRQSVAQKVNGVNIQNVKDMLIDDFFNHTEAWISDEKGIARQQYDDLFSRACAVGAYAASGNGLNLTITDYFNEILAGVSQAEQNTVIDNHVESIMARLLVGSTPSLELQPGVETPHNKTVLLPQSLVTGQFGAQVLASFKKYLNGSNDHVTPSSAVDAIVCYQTSVAVALCELKDLDKWEEDYYKDETNATMHLNNGERASCFTELTKTQTDIEKHMQGVEKPTPAENVLYGTGLSWLHYPSINLRRYEGDFERTIGTPENHFRVNTFVPKVKLALSYGIIEEEVVGHVHKFFLNTLPESWTNLDVSDYRNVNQAARRPEYGSALFNYLVKQNPYADPNYRMQIKLTSTPFFDEGGFDFTQIANIEHWTKEREDRTANEYMLRALRKNTYLYQKMEDTLYRFFAIAKQVEANVKTILDRLEDDERRAAQEEQADVEKKRKQNFIFLFAYGVITTDPDSYEWLVKRDAKGGTDTIISFGKRTTAKMSLTDKKIVDKGLKMIFVYKEFCRMLEDGRTTEDKLAQIKDIINDSMSDAEFDAMVAETTRTIQGECEILQGIVDLSRDKVGAVADEFGIEDKDIDTAEEIVDFYKLAEEIAEHL